jgi:hypothetical protein
MDLKDFDTWMSEFSAEIEEPLVTVKTDIYSKAEETSTDDDADSTSALGVATLYGNRTIPASQLCLQWQIHAPRDAVLNANVSAFTQSTVVIDDLVISVKSNVYKPKPFVEILDVVYWRLGIHLIEVCGIEPKTITNVTLPIDVHAMLHYENGTFEVNMTKALVAKPIKNSDVPSHGHLPLILLLSSGLFWVLVL